MILENSTSPAYLLPPPPSTKPQNVNRILCAMPNPASLVDENHTLLTQRVAKKLSPAWLPAKTYKPQNNHVDSFL